MNLNDRWIDTNNKSNLRGVVFSNTTPEALFMSSLVDLDPICFLCEGEHRMLVNLYVKQR